MTYYINPIWFYLMNLANEVRIFLWFAGGSATILTIITMMVSYFDNGFDINDMDDNEKTQLKKFTKKFTKIVIAGIITFFIGILIPSKETSIEIMVASQVTHENVSATKEEIYKIIDYVADKVNKTEKVEEE